MGHIHRVPHAQGGTTSPEDQEAQAKEKDKWSGSDLLLFELATGKTLNLGNVSEFAFDKKGKWLAWLIDAQNQSGNGVQARDMQTGVILPLDSAEAEYKRLTWTERGEGFAVLKGVKHDDFEDKLFSVLGFKDFVAQGPHQEDHRRQEGSRSGQKSGNKEEIDSDLFRIFVNLESQ